MSATLLSGKVDPRQILKAVIYVLLLVNFAQYVIDDLTIASFQRRNGGTFLQWTSSFATTIDLCAWFVLLLLFELETYVLSDAVQQKPSVWRTMHGIRLLCYVFLAHSVYAYASACLDLSRVIAETGVTQLCQLLAPDVSFTRNLEYVDLTASNCGDLSTGSSFYFVEPGLVVTDSAGFKLEKNLALVDLLEAIVWLGILFTIEVMVWLQDRFVTRGTVVTLIKCGKLLLYGLLWCAAVYWASLGHWYFAWDEALWIIGFFAIEMNVDEWKKEIEGAADSSPSANITIR